MGKTKLLLHTCCGPCSTSSIERLFEMGYQPILYFGNSNIFPKEESDLRYNNLEKVASHFSLEIIRGKYNHIDWLEAIKGHEKEPEKGSRCAICFEYNLKEAAQVAQDLNIEHFTTTLTVSPHKNSTKIFQIGSESGKFVEIDFKKKGGFQRSIELSKELELYRQKYCGCEFSMRHLSQKD
jgi:predicted adenine nucleotide alpha hydrolase (AANH) superfamily ATPase